MYVDNGIEDREIMLQYSILYMLSAKEQEIYVDRLIKQNNLNLISKQVKKRASNLLNNSIELNNLVKQLEKPLSDLNMNDLENRALLLYFALINPQKFNLSKEKVKEIPGIIIQLADYARKQMELSMKKHTSYNRRKSAKFFTGLLICLRNYFQHN